MSRMWQSSGRRSCFHDVLWMGVLCMWSTGASVQGLAIEEETNSPAPEACCWRGLTGGCVVTTEANCSGPCDTWNVAVSPCPGACAPDLTIACDLPCSPCTETPMCNCTPGGGVLAGAACDDVNNILVIVADDLGVDMLNVYGEGFAKACNISGSDCTNGEECVEEGEACLDNLPPTPRIDGLRADGILFRNAWANPTCSPMRSTVQTGRYGFRTGVGFAGAPLPLGEFIIPEVLTPQPGVTAPARYAHAAFGKWHLGGWPTGPNDHGYSHYAGARANVGDYFNWFRTVNGSEPEVTTDYATTVTVDDALNWIGQQTKPWFIWLAFNAPHFPFHAPPDDLHSYKPGGNRPDLPDPPEATCAVANERLCYEAAIEALDTEVGRLLDNMSQSVLDNTLIIFVGDNGTPKAVTVAPFDSDHAKITLYEGGINVPLIISGAGVVNPGRESAALVNTTDLFATILETAGVNVPTASCFAGVQLDSVSLVPIIKDTPSGPHRDYVFSDQFRQRGTGNVKDGQTVRNQEGFKLIHFPNSQTTNKLELYDLLVDPFEETDLYNDELPFLDGPQRLSFQELCDQLESLIEDPSVCPLPPLPGGMAVP